MLARRYVAQYSKSPFSRNYWDEFQAATTRVAPSMTEERIAEFLALFEGTPASTRFELYTTIAHDAIVRARTKLAAAQTERAAALADTRAAKARVALFRASLTALDGDFEDATKQFAELDAKSLAQSDLELRAIVASTMERLQAEPDAAVEAAVSPRPESPAESAARRALARVRNSFAKGCTKMTFASLLSSVVAETQVRRQANQAARDQLDDGGVTTVEFASVMSQVDRSSARVADAQGAATAGELLEDGQDKDKGVSEAPDAVVAAEPAPGAPPAATIEANWAAQFSSPVAAASDRGAAPP